MKIAVHHAIRISFVVSVAAILVATAFSVAAYFRRANGGFTIVQSNGTDLIEEGKILPAPESQAIQSGSWPALSNANFFSQVKVDFINQKKSFIEADLTAMKVNVYKDGEIVKELPILTKGRPGSWWETPAGLYQIQTKERSHFSSFGHVYQPWSMAFQGNFFIHGWPHSKDGTPVASSFSGGCIRLSTADAKIVYDLAKIGMPVLVYEKTFDSDDFKYSEPPSDRLSTLEGLSAKTYLAADLKNNQVFLAQDPAKEVPIASITKLMTALIAAEYINLDATSTVLASSIVSTSVPRLKAGDRINPYQLLYPLLDESSNEAAFMLADYLGRERFVSLMNQKAAALGMTHTRFVDPSGAGEGNISTAEDLFALAKYLLNNRSFILKITSDTVGYNAYGSSQFADLKNFNVFTGQPSFVGGKVGQTIAAGKTIISLFNETLEGQKRPIVIIALGSDDNASDARAILAYVKSTYQ
jgi:D-alanyl-D-alanine carboxypeptidase